MDTLGKKIRVLRREQKLTQHALADGMVTASMISQIESDRAIPSSALLKHIAGRLNVDLSYFESDLLDKSDELQNYRTARQYMANNRYKDAIELLNTLSWPLSPQFKPDVVYNEMASCYVKLGKLAEACRMYECVIQAGYEKDDIATAIHGYYNIGSTLRRMKKFNVARMYWQRASDLLRQHDDMYMPVSLKILSNLARLHLVECNWQASRLTYEEALMLSHQYGGSLDFAKTYQGLACACMQLQDFDMALAYNDQAIAGHVAVGNQKGALKCRINRGVILRHAERYAEASVHFAAIRPLISVREEALTLALLHELTWIAWHEGNDEAVMRESNAALSRTRVDVHIEAELRLLRARVALKANDVEGALRETELGLQLMRTDKPSSLLNALNETKRKSFLQAGREQDVVANCLTVVNTWFANELSQVTSNIST